MKIEDKEGKLVVVDFDEFEAYRIAVKVEYDGIRFYDVFALSVDDPELKRVVGVLLAEERKHLAFFEGCIDRLRREKDDLSEDDSLLNSMDFGIFEPYQSMGGYRGYC